MQPAIQQAVSHWNASGANVLLQSAAGTGTTDRVPPEANFLLFR